MTRRLPEPPERLSQVAFRRLSDDAREEYQRQRFEFLGAEHLIQTPELEATMREAQKILIRSSSISYVARAGLALSGPSTVGKSSTLLEIGRQHHRKVTEQAGKLHNREPVVYVSMGIARTPKMALASFADFLGLGFSSRADTNTIGTAIARVLNDLGTSLVIVDEIHNMSGVRRNESDGAATTLKWLTEHVNATFILAGIDLPSTAIFTGTMGTQFRGRFKIIQYPPCSNFSTTQRQAWTRLVASFESLLLGCLRDHEMGSLPAISDKIFELPTRSDTLGGIPLPHSIGTLKEMIVGAAIDAVLTGSEAVSLQDLANQNNLLSVR